jgi:hypothetical protein
MHHNYFKNDFMSEARDWNASSSLEYMEQLLAAASASWFYELNTFCKETMAAMPVNCYVV